MNLGLARRENDNVKVRVTAMSSYFDYKFSKAEFQNAAVKGEKFDATSIVKVICHTWFNFKFVTIHKF